MTNHSDRSVGPKAFAGLAGICLLALCVGVGAQTPTAPKYKFDPDWPKPLPNKWKIGGSIVGV